MVNLISHLVIKICLFIIFSKFQIINLIQILNDTEIKLGVLETYEIKQVQGCRLVQIPINFKRLILNLDSSNIQRILISDKQINTNCTESEISKCCNKNSTFCMENLNPTQNEFRLSYCTNYVFLYACVNNDKETQITKIINLVDGVSNETIKNLNNSNTTNNESKSNSTDSSTNNTNPSTKDDVPKILPATITIKTSIIKGVGCQSTEYLLDTECSSLGLNYCKDSKKCSTLCSYVECRKEENDSKTSTIFSMCLPAKLSEAEITQRCSNHIVFAEPKPSTPQIYRKNCSRIVEDKSDLVHEGSSHSFFKLLLILFGVLVLSIFIASVYYRFKTSIDGVAPFNPPDFVPNFIFPKQNPFY